MVDRRRLDPGPRLDRIGPPGRRGRPGRPRFHLRDISRRSWSPSPSCPCTSSVPPSRPTGPGIALGLGGLAGAYTGAPIQSRLPDALIRRAVGILVIAIGARYL
jgi:hypothetical protein